MSNLQDTLDDHPIRSTLLGLAAFIVLVLSITWVFQGNDFFLYKTFAPKQEAVRHEVFKQSQAYNDGMNNQLGELHLAYANADSAHKVLLLSTVYSRYASYDASQLTLDNAAFLSAVRAYQLHQTTRLP